MENSDHFAPSDYQDAEASTSSQTPFEDPSIPELAENSWQVEPDDIQTEYHPRSGRDTGIARFQDYGQEAHNLPKQLRDGVPWHPYETRLDFDFSELMLEAALNREQTSRLISLIQRAQSSNGQDSFTITTYSKLTAVRTLAANQYPDVSLFKHT